MKKKNLVLGLATVTLAILIIIAVFAVNLPSQNKPLTLDQTGTLRADSLEIEIKDFSYVEFTRYDSNLLNSSILAPFTANFANFTSVSTSTFLTDIYNYVSSDNGGNHFFVYRVGNTFYLMILAHDPFPKSTIEATCTP